MNNNIDIIHFAENILGFDLQEWQKDLLKSHEQGKMIWIFGGRSKYGRSIVKEVITKYNAMLLPDTERED